MPQSGRRKSRQDEHREHREEEPETGEQPCEEDADRLEDLDDGLHGCLPCYIA